MLRAPSHRFIHTGISADSKTKSLSHELNGIMYLLKSLLPSRTEKDLSITGLTRWPAFRADSACGSMVRSILCMRFFRAERGKTAYEQKSSTAVKDMYHDQ